ncbi:hypothetical protein EJD97_001378 [Solanum chilense]|uniref:Uncharacterized protein n=1 Tax=Solanum chilense TaxID=4083 RepID=A0A6N2C534_SOLCI|nr:hypothetical protein EJD97_001378 [Solanum chilense]
MKLKCSFIVIFFLLLLASPSSGKMDLSKVNASEIYEIDYRGPETHTKIPPQKGRRPNNQHQAFHLNATKPGKNVRKLHS